MPDVATSLGQVTAGEASDTTVISLGEYESSAPLRLSDSAAAFLETTVNQDPDGDRDGDRIKLRYQRDGQAILTATQYVGVVSLPDGPTIEVSPKAAGTNLLWLLRYANGTTATTFDARTDLEAGPTFLDALGSLFEAELTRVINRGLQTSYRRTEGTEDQLRGQLDLQRQFQRQPLQPTTFECTYDELTHDTTANRAILYATTVLLGLVKDRGIAQRLRAHQQTLRRRVTLTPVTTQQLDTIHIDRLATHYTDLLRLARVVIERGFVGELAAGSSPGLAMLVNMNTVFENAVERAFSDLFREFDGWNVRGQETSTSLITKGRHSATLKPDVTVYKDGDPRLVADAKWKTSEPTNADYYQLAAYMLDRDAPGLLVYPECNGRNEAVLEIANQFDLTLCELPTAAAVDSYEDFILALISGLQESLAEL